MTGADTFFTATDQFELLNRSFDIVVLNPAVRIMIIKIIKIIMMMMMTAIITIVIAIRTIRGSYIQVSPVSFY